jgi:hypothetical protein
MHVRLEIVQDRRRLEHRHALVLVNVSGPLPAANV